MFLNLKLGQSLLSQHYRTCPYCWCLSCLRTLQSISCLVEGSPPPCTRAPTEEPRRPPRSSGVSVTYESLSFHVRSEQRTSAWGLHPSNLSIGKAACVRIHRVSAKLLSVWSSEENWSRDVTQLCCMVECQVFGSTETNQVRRRALICYHHI